MELYLIIVPLVVGFALDSILGDPLWLPHPIRLFGNAISSLDKRFNTSINKKLKGALVSIFLIATTYLVFIFIIKFSLFNVYVYYIISSVFVFYGLANRSLIVEGLKVENELSTNGLEAGRKQVGFIVGRDTSKLSSNKIRIAVLETLAENLSDGVIAPLFYYFIGGVPLMLAYKMTNTLDSMIGYKSERYKDFGFFAAKFDDVVNFIPSRITAFIMVLVTLNYKGFIFIFKFGNNHSSPNAGYPESALAGILDCRFGGSNIYNGKMVDKPFIGLNDRKISKIDIYKSCIINYSTSLVFVFIGVVALYFINLY